MPETDHPAEVAELLTLADQCVMCGLCLPHCPTYRLTAHEAESPRGRIAIARSLANGTLAPTPAGLAHLDHCLACLSCEPVCPSRVHYGRILLLGRAALASKRARPSLLQRLLRSPMALVALARIAAALRAHRWLPRVARLLPEESLLRRIATTLPKPPAQVWRPVTKSRGMKVRGRVALFRGCVASIYDSDTHAAARRVLEALGYEVIVPPGTLCCGALALHAGDIAAAAKQAAKTLEAINATRADSVLVSATGCFGSLRAMLADAGLDARVVDVNEFLAHDEMLETLHFRPIELRATLHQPCTQRNVVGGDANVVSLLARIRGLSVQQLPEQPKCCGAAGNYFLEHADFADRLRDEKLDQAQNQLPDLLLTTNIGCRIHLQNGLNRREADVAVMHPLTLLAQQLDDRDEALRLAPSRTLMDKMPRTPVRASGE